MWLFRVAELFSYNFQTILHFADAYDWCYQMMWLVSGAPEDPEDDTVMEKHGAETLYSTVKSVMHAIRTKDKAAQ